MKASKNTVFSIEYIKMYWTRYTIGIIGVFILCILFGWELLSDEVPGAVVYIYDLTFSMGGFGLPLFYFLGGLPATCFFLEEQRCCSVNTQVMRNGKMEYLKQRVLLVAWSPFITIFLGLSLYVGFLCLFAAVNGAPLSDGDFLFYLNDHPFVFLLLRNMLFSLSGTMWSMIALVISSVSKNYYVVFTIPFAMYFFMERMGLYLPEYFDLYHLTQGYETYVLKFPFNCIYIILVMLLVILVCIQIFIWRGRRLIEDGKIT